MRIYFLFVHILTTWHTCPALWALLKQFPLLPAPASWSPSFTTLFKHHILHQASPNPPACSSLPSLPLAPQTLLLVPLLVHFYSPCLCEVIHLCACFLWASKGLTEVKTTALDSDSPDFTSDDLMWPCAFCVTSWSPNIFVDKTRIQIYFPRGFLVGLMYLFVFFFF